MKAIPGATQDSRLAHRCLTVKQVTRAGAPKRAVRGGNRRGATLVEFAIVVPLLVLIMIGCIDFGRFLYFYAVVTNAAQEGASYGSVNPPEDGTWAAKVADAAMAEPTRFLPVPEDLSVNVTDTTSDDPSVPGFVTVEVQYPFRLAAPGAFRFSGLPTTMLLRRTVIMPHTR